MTQESRLAIVIDSTKAKPSADELTRAMNALDAAGVRVTSTTNNVNQSVDQMARQTDAAARALRRGLIAVFGGISAMGIIDMADEWGQMASRIRMATESTEEYEQVQARMLQSANSTYRNINETREAFIQLSPVLRQMGMSLDESMDAIDAFSGLLVTNAASADRGAAALRALSVSLQKGKMDADQWITIYSTLDSLVDVLAQHSGMAAEEIRRLGASGQLSVKMIAHALAGQLNPIMQQVEEMPTTVRDSMQRVGNAFSEYIGHSNEANQVTVTLASGIEMLGENVETILNAAIVASAAGLARYTAGMAVAGAQTAIKIAQSRAAAAEEVRLAQAQSVQTAATLAQATALRGLGATQAQITAATVAHEAATRRLTAAQAAYTGIGRTMLGILGGPAGIAVAAGLAAAAFVDFGSSAQAASVDLNQLTRSLDDLNSAQIAFRRQQAEEKLESLEETAAEAARELQALERDYAALLQMFEDGRGVDAEGLENVNKTLVEQRARVADANQEVEKAQGVLARLGDAARAAAARVDTLNTALRQTDDAGRRYLERLTDQSIVAGLKTQRQQLDALVGAGKLVFSDEDLAAAQRAADIIDRANNLKTGEKSDTGRRYLEDIRERVALLGQETELERMLAQISAGSLTFRTSKQRELAEELAKQFDATQRQIELEEVLRDLREQQNTTQLQFFRELEAFGQGERVRQLNADLAKVEDRYRGIIDARRNSPLGLSDEELSQIRESLQIELDMVREFHEAKLAIQGDWQLGARDALINYADEAANVYESLSQSVGNAFKGMESSLVDFVRTGKADFRSLADSIISDMIRIMIQQSITGPLAAWMGGFVPFAAGGYTGDGARFEPAGIVHRGEGVLNQDEIRALGGESGFNALRRAIRTGHAAGGMGGRSSLPPPVAGNAKGAGVNVTVNVSGGQTQTQAPAGWEDFAKEIGDFVDAKIREREIKSQRQGGIAWQARQGAFS